VPDDRYVQQVIDVCIRIGEVLLSSGEGSGETTETMLRVANAFGLSAVDVDITFTAVTICCHRGMAATPITSMRLVTHRGLDLTLLARVYRLVEQIERGRGLRPSAAALDAAVTATHPYPRWVATTGAAGLAGALALLLGAPAVAVLSAAGITAVIDVTGRFFVRQPLSVEGLTDGLVTITLALAIGLALAAGVTLGQYLTRPQATPLSPADPAPPGTRN